MEDKGVSSGLCLDFVNTVEWHSSGKPIERLNSFRDLAEWSRRANVATEAEMKLLLQQAKEDPPGADNALKRAIGLREALYRIFSSASEYTGPKEEDMAILNRNLSATMAGALLVPLQGGFSWDVNGRKDALDWLLNSIIRSAADLLVSDDLKRLKRCADPDCGWLFLDNSRNHSRRWCDMKDCGNRAKARRFYSRKKEVRK